MSAPVPRRAETASSAGAMVPTLASAARGRAQTAYRVFLNHPQNCADCAAQRGRCEAAQQLWDTYRQDRG